MVWSLRIHEQFELVSSYLLFYEGHNFHPQMKQLLSHLSLDGLLPPCNSVYLVASQPQLSDELRKSYDFFRPSFFLLLVQKQCPFAAFKILSGSRTIKSLQKTVWQDLLKLQQCIPMSQQFCTYVYTQRKYVYLSTKRHTKNVPEGLFVTTPNC